MKPSHNLYVTVSGMLVAVSPEFADSGHSDAGGEVAGICCSVQMHVVNFEVLSFPR